MEYFGILVPSEGSEYSCQRSALMKSFWNVCYQPVDIKNWMSCMFLSTRIINLVLLLIRSDFH